MRIQRSHFSCNQLHGHHLGRGEAGIRDGGFRHLRHHAVREAADFYSECVGEAALLLAAGSKDNRACLPSATIMLKQPIAQFRGYCVATDIDIARKEVRNVKEELVNLISRHTGQSPEKTPEDIQRQKYFEPDEAVDYGIIDKVLYAERDEKRSIASDLKKAQVI